MYQWGLLLVLGLLVLGPRIFADALHHWDEAWYAQVCREMQSAGDWWTLRWHGTPWFHKPPLFFWLTLGSWECLGEAEWTCRIIPATCSLFILLLISSWVHRCQLGHSWLAGLLLLALPDFVYFGTRGQLDSLLTLWLCGYLACGWHFYQRLRWCAANRATTATTYQFGDWSPRSIWSIGLAGFFLGAGLLTKGAAAGLGPAILILFFLLRGQLQLLWHPWMILVHLLAVGLALPWHVQQYWQHGTTFLQEYGSRHFCQFYQHIYRETPALPYDPWFYFEFLCKKQTPWSWIILTSIGISTVQLVWHYIRGQRQKLTPAFCFCWCWGVGALILLSLARTKMSWYLLPLYPGQAMLFVLLLQEIDGAASTMAQRWKQFPWECWHRLGCYCLVSLITAGILLNSGKPWLWPGSPNYETEIRQLAKLVQAHLPTTCPLVCLQSAKASESVYPTTTLYYGQRPIHVLNGAEALYQAYRKAPSPLFVMSHATHYVSLWRRLQQTEPERFSETVPLELKPIRSLGRVGPIHLLYLVPTSVGTEKGR